MKKKSKPKEERLSQEMTHDQFVHIIWSNLFVARLFIERYLAPEVLSEIDLDSLELAPTRNTTKKGRDSVGDVYYKFRFKSGKRGVLVVVVEHKARYARFVAIQILRYEVDVLEYMSQNFKQFADDDGRLPTPYSILLCPKRCPQLEELTSRCEGIEYGPRTRFQTINFNEIDLESTSDEPFLQIAMGLSRFAGYSDKKRGKRQDELVKLFRALLYYDPSKREQRREIWELILDVSLNYLSRLMRKHDFEIGRFVRNLVDTEKEKEMGYALFPDVFASIFPKEAQELQQQIVVANTRADEANVRANEANARANALERLLCENTREKIYGTLVSRRWFKETPSDLTNALEKISSYESLAFVLSTAKEAANYDAFLTAFKKVKR